MVPTFYSIREDMVVLGRRGWSALFGSSQSESGSEPAGESST